MHTNQALRAYGCAECTFLTCQGFERYCGGFPEKRKPKRFWKTDPQWKAPKWCPRRKTPAVYRVYHYKNDGSMLLSNALLHFDGKGHGAMMTCTSSSPSGSFGPSRASIPKRVN